MAVPVSIEQERVSKTSVSAPKAGAVNAAKTRERIPLFSLPQDVQIPLISMFKFVDHWTHEIAGKALK
jgi:hypothetical protein